MLRGVRDDGFVFQKRKTCGIFFWGGGKMFVRNLFVFFFLGPKDEEKKTILVFVKEGQGNKC